MIYNEKLFWDLYSGFLLSSFWLQMLSNLPKACFEKEMPTKH